MKTLLFRAAVLLVALVSFPFSLRAGLDCFGLTDNNRLVRFDTDTPGAAAFTNITGLPATHTAVGMAIRTTKQTIGAANPGPGSIWIVTCHAVDNDNFRLYVVNPATGAASLISLLGDLGTSAGISGWALGFNPGTDRFQFLGERLNYEINPNTGAAAPKTFFPGFPAYSGAAFTTASFGETTQFFNVDCGSSPDNLQTSANISSGSVSVVGPLGISVSRPVGLAIFEGSTFFAEAGNFYTINRSTGAATLVGAIMTSPSIRGLAILPASFPPKLPVTVKVKGPKKITTTDAKVTIKGTAKSKAGIKRVEYRVGKGKFKKAKGTKKWKFKARLEPGRNKIQVRAIGGNDVVSKPAKVKVTRVLPL